MLPGFERPDQSGIVFTLRGEEGLIWAEGHALNVDTFFAHHAQLDNLAKLTGHPIVLRTPNTPMVHCIGPLESVERIRDLFSKKVAREKRLPIYREE